VSRRARSLNNFAHFSDGTANTLLVVEAADAVEWTKPDELIYHPNTPVPALGYFWNRTGNVLFADVSVREIKDSISESTLRALITAQAGDQPGNDF
jgi:hypothetical protein